MSTDDVVHTDSWAEVEATLVEHLSRLHRHGFVTLDPPQPPSVPSTRESPRRGLLGRFRRPVEVRDRPLLQLSRGTMHLEAECSGPVGDVPVSTAYGWDEDQQRRLLELGWTAPDELDDWHMYRWCGPAPDGLPDRLRQEGDDAAAVPPDTAADAARLVVSTLHEVFGMRGPAGLSIVVDRFPG